jgi:dihydroxy-acid dehydratase
MAATTLDLPAIVLSGGPMLDAHWRGKLAGSGTIHWEARKLYATGELDDEGYIEMALAQVPSTGHCNTMGTATTMNSLAETLGLSLKGCAAIPAPYRERAAMAYRTGKAAVEMVLSDRRPSQILTRPAFENAIRMTTALGGSTNAQIHITAIARHAGIEIDIADWEQLGYDVPLLVNLQPAGEFLGEAFHKAGGVPAVLWELKQAGKLNVDCLTCDGGPIGARAEETKDRRVIFAYDKPMREQAGFLVMRGNLFDSAVMKTSVIDDDFRTRYLAHPDHPGAFEARAIVFDGSEDYHARLNDPALRIDENSILVIRQAGPVGWPGSAEVVNMQPPDALLKRGIRSLPTMGDGRQSGTSGSPSILHVTPEAALGGGLALLKTGDKVRVDIPNRRVDLLLPEAEIAARRAACKPTMPADQTPWQHVYRKFVGPLSTGACLDFALAFSDVAKTIPRHNH